MKPAIRRAYALCAALTYLLALLVTAPAAARDGDEPAAPIVKKRKIAPGVTFTRIIERREPRRTFVLRIRPSTSATLDVTLADATLGSPRRTVLYTANAHDAVAAVNGDFTGGFPGRPTHVFAQDGHLVQSHAPGTVFALARDETAAFVGPANPVVSLSDRDTGQTWRLDRWNFTAPFPGELAGFSPLGGTEEAPPPFACSVRLLRDGPISFDDDRTGVVSDHVVDRAACAEEPMERDGGIVISTPPATDEAIQLLAMGPGSRMRLRWSIGVPGVYDIVGGMPILVQDGQIVVSSCPGAFCGRNPRTGIGFTANGSVLLVVVDGRQPRWSVGASLREFAMIMHDLGAVQALNLDGGGSSAMVVKSEVVNRPSDGQQRPISNTVLVLSGPDLGEE